MFMHEPNDSSNLFLLSMNGKPLTFPTYKPIFAIVPAAAMPWLRQSCAKTFLHIRQNLLDSPRPAIGLPPVAAVQAGQQ